MAEQKAAKKTRRPASPKPVFVVYTNTDGDIDILKATRRADIALSTMDENPGAKYKKVDVE